MSHFPPNVIRCKGIIWIEGEDDTSFLLEQVERLVRVQFLSPWLATAPVKEREDVWKRDSVVRDNWDEQVGDRMIKLVFIGVNMDERKSCDSLDRCLAKF